MPGVFSGHRSLVTAIFLGDATRVSYRTDALERRCYVVLADVQMWWEMGAGDDGKISIHGKWRPITYDLQADAVLALLGEPVYRFIRDDSGVAVIEWKCGCTACHTSQTDRCTVQWCSEHNILGNSTVMFR